MPDHLTPQEQADLEAKAQRLAVSAIDFLAALLAGEASIDITRTPEGATRVRLQRQA